MSNFMKIPPVEDECFYADGRKDGRTDTHDKLIVAFRSFMKAPKNCLRSFAEKVCVHYEELTWHNGYIL